MADKTFRLEIIAPDRIFYSNDIYMVEYNTVEGEVGIYADHIPMTQIIAPGRLIITERNEEAKTRAERRLSSEQGGVDIGRAELALKRAITRLDVAGK